MQDAEAYRERVIADAEGQAARFEALLTEYQKAPRVTRDRLYIEAVEQVYGDSAKVLIDTDGSGNLLMLPLSEIMRNSGIQIPSVSPSGSSASQGRQQTDSNSESNSARERRTRQ